MSRLLHTDLWATWNLKLPHITISSATVVVGLLIVSLVFHKGIRERCISIIAVWPFFTRRYDFLRSNLSGRNFFSFKVLQHTVTAMKGEEARKSFYNDKSASILEGYKILTGGAPLLKDINVTVETQENVTAFNKQLLMMLGKERLSEIIPALFNNLQNQMHAWGKEGTLDPFKNVYGIVFRLTVGMATSRELLADTKALERLQHYYWVLEKSATPSALLLPNWVPVPGKIKRLLALKNLYFDLLKFVDKRRAATVPNSDAIDFMIAQGKTNEEVVGVVLGVIFAGVVNTGITACWILLYITFYGEWKKKISVEVQTLVQKHTNTTSSDPLHKRLAAIPISVWEDEMPVLEAVLRETLRMAINGTTLRRNLLEDLNIQGEIISKGEFMAYSQADAHMDPDIYAKPKTFDPERFSVGRAEDKHQTHAFLGWGAGRHPCTGMKVAKLEIKIIVAMFVAGYEFDIVDSQGKFPKAVPNPNFNDIHQARPIGDPCFLKFKRVVE